MNETPHNTYQKLTKRSKRLSELAESLDWTPNIWIGTSLENEDVSYPIKDLRKSACSYSISLT
ncbi:Phage protein Gp37/Gp68 [Bacillus sp. OK838]|nr:Phage protein Gp37/Gp68 [Bacillus sp. OK838]